MDAYNRGNPFLYTFDAVNQKLVEETEKAIKYLMIYGILEVFVIGLSITRWIIYQKSQAIPIVITIGLFLYGILEIRKSIHTTQSMQVDVVNYGNSSMTYTYVNNEELFTQVNTINIHLGKITSIKESFVTYDIICLAIITVQTLAILIYIFK
jgi:hypothetical protein